MKLLIIEDDEETIATFQKELGKREDIEVDVARSRDLAIEQISSKTFDFAVVDLKIPPTEGALDSHTDHGLAVRSALAEKAAGTPAVIFSAFGTMHLVQGLLETTTSHYTWTAGMPHPMTRFLHKGQIVRCLELINGIADEIRSLSRIEISFGAQRIDLTYPQLMLLRIFAARHGGIHVRIALLGGGLSDAKTCRLQIEDEHGSIKCYAVVKFDKIAALREEDERYQTLVSPVLRIGTFAHVIQFLTTGGAGIGGLFYGLAKEYDWTLIDALKKAPGSTPAIVTRLRDLERPWRDIARTERLAISAIRASLISDAQMRDHARELSLDRSKLEEIEVRVTMCQQHRDLHGLNVLLKSHVEPLVIDFAKVGPAPASLDPLTLELSLLFHPACKGLYPDWPSLQQAQCWDNLDVFTADCPIAEYVRSCRKWAFDTDASDQSVFATAYSYAVRQLKYPSTDHKLAVAIAECCGRLLLR